MLVAPKIIVLDSATLGKISRDYWSVEILARDKAREFLALLLDGGIYIAVSLTHVLELLRYQNKETVRDRIKFLRQIPLLAWIRPYNRAWFPGGLPDLLCRELHAATHGSAKDWREIIENVRPELWETGTGAEMFVENDELWSAIEKESKRQHENEKYIASVARTDAGNVDNMKIREALKLPTRSKEERADYLKVFATEMKRQLDHHGDIRFVETGAAAMAFAKDTLNRVATIEANGPDLIEYLLKNYAVPARLMKTDMTVGEFGELAIWAKQLKLLSEKLNPARHVSMEDVHLDTLPSYVVERRLRSIQQKAERVSGSDFGDGYIASLVFYSDGVEVDKRTYEFLMQIKRSDLKLASIMGKFFRALDYMQIPKLIN